MKALKKDLIREWQEASEYQDLDDMKYLLSIDRSLLNASFGKDDFTALMYNIYYCASTSNIDKKVFDFLIKQPDLDVNMISTDGDTALMLACHINRKYKIKRLLEHPSMDINTQTCNFTALVDAIYNNVSIKTIEVLLNDPSIDVTLDCPLLDAAENCKIKAMEVLLKHPKIDANVVEDIGDFFDILDKKLQRNDVINYINVIKKKYMPDHLSNFQNANINALIDYDLQKIIIQNNPENMKVFHKHDRVHPKIKEEYAYLFSGVDLNLI
jgi:ankyrin repeat protein